MSKYELLEGKVHDILEKEEVIDTDVSVSAYSLQMMVEDRFFALRNAYEIANYMPEKIQMILTDSNHSVMKNIIPLSLRSNHSVYCESVYPYYHLRVGNINEDYLSILFSFSDHREKKYYEVCKDLDDNQLYSGYEEWGKLDPKIFDACLEDIETIFSILEDFYHLFSKDVNWNSHQTHYGLSPEIYNDENFIFKIQYDLKGNVETSLHLSSTIDEFGVQNREWYGKREKLHSFITSHKDDILKRIAIPISQLNPICLSIFEETKKGKIKEKI